MSTLLEHGNNGKGCQKVTGFVHIIWGCVNYSYFCLTHNISCTIAISEYLNKKDGKGRQNVMICARKIWACATDRDKSTPLKPSRAQPQLQIACYKESLPSIDQASIHHGVDLSLGSSVRVVLLIRTITSKHVRIGFSLRGTSDTSSHSKNCLTAADHRRVYCNNCYLS